MKYYVQKLFIRFLLGMAFNNCVVGTDLSGYARFGSYNFSE